MAKESSFTLSEVINFSPESIYWLDINGFYQGCNPVHARRMRLRSNEEITGKSNQDLACFKEFTEAAETLDLNNLHVLKSNSPMKCQEIFFNENGELSVYLSHKTPLHNINNEVVGLICISYNIKEFKAEERRLLTENENLELTLKGIINRMPGHVYWKDQGGHYLGCNTKQAESLGLKSETDIIGKTDFDLPWRDKAEEIRKNDLMVMETGQALIKEETGKLANGSIITAMSQKIPLKSKQGQVTGVIGISMDITELKRAQENEKLALQKSAADEATKRALLIFSGMSTHDLRTPLSSINLRAAFLKKYIPALTEGYKAAAQADFDIPHLREAVLTDLQQAPFDILQGVREANDYIDSSLKSLKNASQGEDLIDKNQLVDCNAERLLRRIVDNYPYKDNQQQFLHWDNEVDFNFKGNVIFFNRLIENLIKNAFEQIELKGRGEIFIHCSENDKFNTLSIKDSAGGVTQAIIDKLFSGIQSTKQGGTGIGLSSAKQIMQGMNGDIECHLVDGDCIEFRLSFPKTVATTPL